MFRDFMRNLYAGARLSFLLPVDRDDFRPSLDQAFLLLIAGSAAMLCVETGAVGGGWLPPPDRVGFYALALVAGLVGCFAATRLLGVTERLSTIIVMILSGAVWMIPVFAPVFLLADAETVAPNTPAGVAVGILLVLWFLGIAIRAIHSVTGAGIIRPAVAASILVIFTALPKLVLTSPAAWLPAPAKLPHGWTQENLYYGQFGMMDRTIGWLSQSRPGKTDLYFVGFGADARESVFVNEMKAVARLFETRFATADRAAVMINNRSTVRQAPLANVHNLGRTINEIGKRMNKDEDVLFLYLSAPGLTDGELAPEFEPLDFVRIHPSAIRQMMDEAEIKYRVIVLSACSADGFARHLRGPNSLVVVATGRSKQDAACKGDAPFTPFGRAFFDTALSTHFDIPAAVEAVTASSDDIGRIEVKMGEVISAKLAETARQIEKDLAEASEIPKVTAPKLRTPGIRKR